MYISGIILDAIQDQETELYLKMYEYSSVGRAEEIVGRSAGHDGHCQHLHQGADGQQDHGIDIADRFDQSRADGEEGARQKRQEHTVPFGAVPVILASVAELFGILIGWMDTVVRSGGLYAELHRDVTQDQGKEQDRLEWPTLGACCMLSAVVAVPHICDVRPQLA